MHYYIGLDVSLAETSVCVLDEMGDIVREAKVNSDPADLATFIRELCQRHLEPDPGSGRSAV